MTRVVAPSRLHFGLLHLPIAGQTHWPGPMGEAKLPIRRFGGVGLTIADPGVAVRVTTHCQWQGQGPNAERAVGFAQEIVKHWPNRQPLRIEVEQCPPQHVGLGVGTQLGLAIARAVEIELMQTTTPIHELAQSINRGERSGIGIEAFAQGGFLVEAGQPAIGGKACLLQRCDWPEEWPIVLARFQETTSTWSGTRERQAFAQIQPSTTLTDTMCRILVLGMLPALLERDCVTFGQALTEYNRYAGRMYREEQGGDYASPEVEALIDSALSLGASGAGQSSWGPTVFAICDSVDHAEHLRDGLLKKWDNLDCTITHGVNQGARIETDFQFKNA